MPFKDSTWPERIDSLIRLFFYIMAFWLPYAPAVIESCVMTALVLWVIKRTVLFAKSGGKDFLQAYQPPASVLNRLIYFFLLICVFSVLSSVLWQRALGDFLSKFVEWFIVFWLIQESFKDKKQIFLLLGIFLFSAAAVAVDGILQHHVLGKDIFKGRPVSPDGRATASFNAPASFGGYLAAVIPLSVSVLMINFRKTLKPLWLLVIGVMMWSLMLTFVRGAWVGAFTGVLVFGLIYFLLRGNFEIVKTLSIAMLFITLTILFPLILNMDSTLKLLNRSNTVAWRLNVWKDTVPMIKDRPLFGHGINTYMPVFQAYRRDPTNHPTYAHNCFVQLAAECGLLGLGAFLWIFLRFFMDSLRQLRIMEEHRQNVKIISIGLLAGVAGFLVHSFFDTNFYSLQLGILLWFFVGMQTKLIQLR